MERPLCPLCGVRHYAREAHVFKSEGVGSDSRGRSVEVAGRMAGSGVVHGEGQSVGLAGVVPSDKKGQKSPPVLGAFDRTAYQREYVKVWRAVRAGRASWTHGRR